MKRIFTAALFTGLLILLPVLILIPITTPMTSSFASAADAGPAEEPPEKCTGAYVGRAVSAEGTMIIARSEDQLRGAYNKMFFVQPATDSSGGRITDTGEGQKGFSVEIPDRTLKYTYLMDATDLDDGPYYACCMNERGVTVDGTVTTRVSEEYAALDPLKGDGDGLRESILPAVAACQATSAEDAVKVLASCIDRYGSAESSTTLISDREEAWIFEIYGGSTYAAMRLPDDMMAVFGNQIMLGWTDLEAKDGFVFSPKLRSCLEKLSDPEKKGESSYHLARSIAPGPREPYSNMRTWRGQQLFAPASTGKYSDDEFYPLLFSPEDKVSVTDLMQLYGDRYEGTEYDMRIPGNEDMRPIGVTRQSDVHIVQSFKELPESCCQLQWLAMGNAEHAIFVPAFSGISDTFEKYKVDDEEGGAVNDSYYYVCKSICSVAESDREYLSRGVKDFNLAQEKKMQKEITEALPDIKSAYASSEEEGAAFVTDLGMRMAKEQYRNAQDMYRRLLFTQMDNLNDSADKETRTVFCMPGFDTQKSDAPDTDRRPADGRTILIIALLCLLIALTAADIVIRKNQKEKVKEERKL